VTDRETRYVRVKADTLVAIQKAMEPALGMRAAECLVAGARVGEAKHVTAPAGDAPQHVETVLAAATGQGWGEFALERFGANELVVTVRRSPRPTDAPPAPSVTSRAGCSRPSRWRCSSGPRA